MSNDASNPLIKYGARGLPILTGVIRSVSFDRWTAVRSLNRQPSFKYKGIESTEFLSFSELFSRLTEVCFYHSHQPLRRICSIVDSSLSLSPSEVYSKE